MSTHHGEFVWHELLTTDADAAIAFYSSVVGWTARDAGMADMRYDILHVGEAPMGGLMGLPAEHCPGGRPGWIGYIGVDDVDAYTARLVEAGGQVMMGPADIPGVGRFSMAADPQGAAIVLFRGTDENAPARPMEPGFVGWNELLAEDGATALPFYSALFGWTLDQSMAMDEAGGDGGGTYLTFKAGGQLTGGIMTRDPASPGPMWLFYFIVGDIDEAADRIRAGGGQVIREPLPMPGGFNLVAVDPQGALFALAGSRAEAGQ